MKGCNLNNFNLILVLIIIIIVISMIYKYEKFQSSCKADKLPKHSNNSNNRNNITINSPYIYSSNNDKDKIIKLQGSGLDSNNIPFGTSEELYAEKLGMLIGQGAAHNYEIIGINEACKIKNKVECGNANAIGCLWDITNNHCGLSEDLKIQTIKQI